MKNMAKGRKAAAVFGIAIAVFVFVLNLYSVRAAQAGTDTDIVVSAAAQILYSNEGSYTSVNPNDNGAVSIGKLQWHGWRALSLLQTIVKANDTQAKKLLGDALYKEVKTTADTTKWSTRKLNAAETSAVTKLLAADESKAAQDALANKDITEYIQQAKRLGITNEPALVYFADLANQGGAGAAGRVATSASKIAGSYAAVTLNEMHEAAICDSVMGSKAYHSRRFATYKYAAELGWIYCNSGDSYIPYDYITASGSGAAWVQRALNACMNAGLTVSGVYDEATKTAVVIYQTAKSLEVDGYAGKDTIVSLIQAVVSHETVIQQTPSENPSENPTGQPSENPAEQPSNNLPEQPSNNLPEQPSNNPAQQPENPPSSAAPPQKAVLTSAKKKYAVNDTQGAFALGVASNHADAPITYQSSNESIVKVSRDGLVSIAGAGVAEITASQAQTDTYAAAELTISVTVYSTNPKDYTVPSGALYAEKNMKKQHVQWLQAALITLGQADITVNGAWSNKMTKLVTEFQAKCGISADGIAGTQTQDIIKKLLAVKNKKPALTISSSAAGNTLTWKKYTKANRVYIYRRETGVSSYKRIKTITNMSKTSYQDKTAKKGTAYSYVVRYGYVQNKVKIAGPASKGAAGVVK